jgi:GDP-L-fucose synthase
MKSVLITGASGFLGRHLKRKINKLGWNIFESNTKIANLIDIKNLDIYNEIKFDYIFHLAAYTKAGDWCLYHQGEQFDVNQTINTNILKYWKERQPQAKMIAMGTSCSYDPQLPKHEDNYLHGKPFSDLFAYAMTKRMLLVGLQSYAEQYGLEYMYYIPSTLYGPKFEISDNHFIFDLIKKIHSGKNNGSIVELWGTGDQKRELVYVDDAIDLMMNTLDHKNQCLNLASGDEYSIKHFAEQISKIYDFDKSKIVYNVNKYTGVLSKQISTAKIHNILPDFTFTPLENGLKETIIYYNAQVSPNVLGIN